MTPAAITLTVFLIALALFIADFLPMGLMVFMVPMALYFCGVIEAKEIFAPLVGQSIILEPGGLRFKDFFKPGICLSALAFVVSMALLPILYPFYP